MEAENLLMFAVSSQDFLPASIRQLREKADKSLDHASQIVTRQHRFADLRCEAGRLLRESSSTPLPISGQRDTVRAIPELGRSTS